MVTREAQPVATEYVVPTTVVDAEDSRMKGVAQSVETDLELLDINEPAARMLAKLIEEGDEVAHSIEITPGLEIDPGMRDRILAKFPVPEDPDSDGGVASMIHRLLPQIISYVQLPEVEDFWDQDEVNRKEWEIHVREEYGIMGSAIIGRNRLRSNPMGWAASAIDTLSAVIPAIREDLAEDLSAAFPMIDSRVFETRLMTNEEKALANVDLSTDAKRKAAEVLTTGIYRDLPLAEKRKVVQSVIDASMYLLDVLDKAPAIAEPVVAFGPNVIPANDEEENVA